MRKLILSAIAVSMAFAPAFVAGADSIDDDFVRMVNNAGVGGAAVDLITNAHLVCDALDGGSTPKAIADAIVSSLHFRPDRAVSFAALSVTHYCPQYGNQTFNP